MGEQDGLTSGKGGSGGKAAGVVTGEETEGSGLDGWAGSGSTDAPRSTGSKLIRGEPCHWCQRFTNAWFEIEQLLVQCNF